MSGLIASIAIAKPMFWAPATIAVLMPTTWPAAFDERAARVAGVDGGVGLDQVVEATRCRRRSSGP